MTKNSKITPTAVRAWLAANISETPRTMAQICEGFGAEPGDERRKVNDAVRYSVFSGYLTRSETNDGPVYELSGNGMRRVVLTDEERRHRARERDRKRDRSNRTQGFVLPKVGRLARAARVANQAANTPAPAGRRRNRAIAPPCEAETVEQFLARGGKVEILEIGRAHV